MLDKFELAVALDGLFLFGNDDVEDIILQIVEFYKLS